MKLKKFGAGLAALCMMGAVVPVLPNVPASEISLTAEAANETTADGVWTYDYKLNSKDIVLYSYNGTDKKVIIPSEIDGNPVKRLRLSLFDPTLTDNVAVVIEEVQIPNGIETIDQYVFANTNLKSVVIPDSVTHISDGVFSGCENLETVVFGKGSDIASWVFGTELPNLKDVTILSDAFNVKNMNAFFAKAGAWKNVTFHCPEGSELESFFEEYNANSSHKVKVNYDNDLSGVVTGEETTEATTEATTETTIAPAQTVLTAGDATGDGKVDILDAITVNKAILGKEALSPEQLAAIDFNGNGKPDSEEALKIMKYIVGLVDSLTD